MMPLAVNGWSARAGVVQPLPESDNPLERCTRRGPEAGQKKMGA